MAIYREDIVDVELESGTIFRSFLNHTIGSGDKLANRFGVRTFRNGEPENIGGTCSGFFIRADGSTVVISGGTVNGNLAYVDLPEACYAVEGQFALAIKCQGSGVTGTIRIVDGVVSRTSTDAVVDPGTIIPSIEELIEAINEAVDSIPSDYSEVVENIGLRQAIFPNIGEGALNALTYSEANNVYTVTVNHDFRSYGFDFVGFAGISIGKGLSCDYPMPSSVVSSAITGWAILCFDRSDRTTNTWQFVTDLEFKNNLNLRAVAVFYHTKAYVLDSYKSYFTNSLESESFLGYENLRIAGVSFWNTLISNVVAPISGKINYIPSEYKITFENVILGSSVVPASFTTAISSGVTVDWHEEANPSYARFIYFDLATGQVVALCYGQSHPTIEEAFTYRGRKRNLALICAVYQNNYVFTCGSALPGRWYKNGVDVYADNYPQSDLHKAFQRVGVIGDSLSVGYMYNKETGVATSRMLKYSWVKEVMKTTGVPWLNIGTSGQNVLTWCTNATYGKTQAEATGNKCQAYIIGLGENDQSDSDRGCPLGVPSDIVDDYSHVATTYYGGYARIIQILKHLNPNCKIFCLTNPRTGQRREEYNVAVRYIAGTYYTESDNVFLVDLYKTVGYDFNSLPFLPVDSYTIQGGHYSAIGYSRIATILQKEISRVMEEKQTYFVDIAFIDYDTGTPTANTMTE